jgi:hypothetical protein
METLERLVETKDLKTSRLIEAVKHGKMTFLRYDSEWDAMILMLELSPTPTVAHFIDQHVALLYDPGTMEVLGFQVEAFVHSFLPAHENLLKAWRFSDSGKQLEDIADLIVTFEQKKVEMARQMVTITAPLLPQMNDFGALMLA